MIYISNTKKSLWLPTFLGEMGVLSSLDYIYFEGDIEQMHYSFVLCVEKIK